MFFLKMLWPFWNIWTLISHECKLKTLFSLFTKQQFDWPRLLDVISFPLSIRVNFVGRHVFSRMSRLHAHHNGLKNIAEGGILVWSLFPYALESISSATMFFRGCHDYMRISIMGWNNLSDGFMFVCMEAYIYIII